MDAFIEKILKHRRIIIVFYVVLALMGAILSTFVAVNYNINDYLPESAASTIALETMENEFDSDVPNARIMVEDISIPEALEFKEQLLSVDGVNSVTWLDDSQDITVPLEMMDSSIVETYYQDNSALYSVALDTDKAITAIDEIKTLTTKKISLTGDAVSTATATEATEPEVKKIAIIAVIVVFIILFLTTTSWADPIIFMLTIGIAVLINRGTNILLGEISFVSNAAGSILQLAVSMDYSIFLMDRFATYRKSGDDSVLAMTKAVKNSFSSISASALTTIIGFAALLLMKFKLGVDLGLVMTKSIIITIIVVFTFLPAVSVQFYKVIEKFEHRSFMPTFKYLSKFVLKIRYVMVVIFFVLAIPCYFIQNQNTFYYGSSHILTNGTEYYEDTTKIESIFGKSNQMVLMVPKGSTAIEGQLSDELNQLDYVKDIISYVDSAGISVPKEYLDESLLDQLDGENYTRFVLTIDSDYEGDQAFDNVQEIKQITSEYYEEYHLAGAVPSTYDMKNVTTADMKLVNAVAIIAVFIIIVLTTKTILLPAVLVLVIEGAIWVNLSLPALTNEPIFYISYLIISSIQLGATVDYAIAFSDRYLNTRKKRSKILALDHTIRYSTLPILTSGSILTIVGFILGKISTHGILAELGILLYRGTLFSLMFVLLALPGFLTLFDRWILKFRFSKNRKEVINDENK